MKRQHKKDLCISHKSTLLKILSERFTNFKVFDTSQIKFINEKYDLILCNNVFSVIPFDTEIKNIIQLLKVIFPMKVKP